MALMTGSYRLSQAAYNAHIELQYLRKTLSQFSPQISSVIIYRPSWDSTILDVPPSDFTYMAVNRSPIEGFPRGILKELGLDYRNISVSFATSEKRVHVIDNIEVCMDGAGFAEKPERDSPYDLSLPNEEAQPHVWIKLYGKDNLIYGIERAFDESLQEWSFWETSMREPIIVDLEYKTAQTLLAYTLQSGPVVSGRMPISWTISASIDGVTWIPIDEHREMEIWRDNEERKFVVKSPGPHRFYRFVFEKAEAPEIMRIYEIGLHLSQ